MQVISLEDILVKEPPSASSMVIATVAPLRPNNDSVANVFAGHRASWIDQGHEQPRTAQTFPVGFERVPSV